MSSERAGVWVRFADMTLDLHIEARGPDQVKVGYTCPCGCMPSVEYPRGAEPATDLCCCGNQFAVGVDAARHLHSQPGFRAEQTPIDMSWDEPIEAAWLIGQSVHADREDHAAHS